MSEAFPIVPDARYRLLTASSNQTVFSVTFPFLGVDELTVYKIALNGTTTTLARPANYTVTGAGNPLGGSITLKLGVPAGTKILIVGTASRNRSQDVTRGGKYSTAATDADFDRLTIIAQELDREDQRTVKVPYGDTPPSIVPGADQTLAKWLDGNLVAGPDATALEHVEAALAVEAGRALVYPAAPADEIYDAGGRPIRNLADGIDATDAATRGQLDALTESFGLEGIDARFDAVELSVARGWKTGDLKLSMFDDDQSDDGWLLVDARTIGDESSGATSRAHADCEALFLRIWAKFDNTQAHIQTSSGVETTRGANAASDWAAHRRLPLLAAGGEFLRVLDMGRGVDPDRALGSAQADMVKNHTHPLTMDAVAPHSHTFGVYNGDSPANTPADGNGGQSGTMTTSQAGGHIPTGTIGNTTGGGAENRPRNIAFPLFVKL